MPWSAPPRLSFRISYGLNRPEVASTRGAVAAIDRAPRKHPATSIRPPAGAGPVPQLGQVNESTKVGADPRMDQVEMS